LREDLLMGEYEAGTRLRVGELAEKLGVSTMPVREALVALEKEGLVDMLPRRGFRAGQITSRDIEDVFLVHALISAELAERAAQSITEKQLADLMRLQGLIEAESSTADRYEHLSDRSYAEIERLNYDFHATINHASDSRRLGWFLRATTRYVPPRFFEVPGWVEVAVRDHPGIIDALAARDGGRAKELIIGHFLHGGSLAASLRKAGIAGSLRSDQP
jgi:DNA-binding GntR family transcriptional regulator